MLPYYDTLVATYAANYESLAAIDTEGLYTCLAPECCLGMDNTQWTNSIVVQFLLTQYLLTGALPVIENPCCPTFCGSIDGGVPDAFTAPTFAAATVTGALTAGTLVLGGAPSIAQIRRGNGTLVGGTLAIAGTWVTATTRIVATYKTASPGANANLSTVNSAGVGFTVNGEGTHAFDWIAVV